MHIRNPDPIPETKTQLPIHRDFLGLVLGILVLFGLYLTSLHNYLLFHVLAELFSIIVAFGIFLLVWNSRQFLDNHYLLFIGIAFLFVGAIDLAHTLSYKGMGVFQGFDANLPTQLWVAGRYVQSLSFLAAFFFIRRKPNTRLVLAGYTLVTSLLFLSILYWGIFPTCFVEGKGLTSFKRISEYVICFFFLISILLLLKNRNAFDRGVLQWLVLSLLATIGSELFFTFYISVYDLSNLSGHFLKILSFFFVYKAIIETGLAKPYALLFRNLREERDKAQKYLDIAGVIFVVIKTDQTVSLINRKGCEILGYGEKEIIGKNWFDTFLPEWDRGRVRKHFLELISGEIEPPEYFEGPVLTRGCEERIVAWHNAVLRNEKNQIVATLSSGEDITRNKEMEKTLAHLASFPELNPNPIVEVGLTGHIDYLNPAARQLFSGTRTDDVQREWLGDLGSLFHTLKEKNACVREIKIGSSWYQQFFYVSPIQDHIRIYSLDITDRKRAEDQLRRSRDELELKVQERTRSLQERVNELNCLYSISDILNKERFSREEPAETLDKIIHLIPSGWRYPEITCARLSLGDEAYQTRDFSETPWKQSSPIALHGESVGTLEVFYLEEKPLCDEGPFLREERRLIESIARQVGEFLEMKEAQEHLVEQARILEAFFTATITPLVLLDKDFNFIRVNGAYARACGRDIAELIGRNHFDLYPSDAKKIFAEVVRTKNPHQVSAKPFTFPDHPEWGVTYWDWTLTPALNSKGEVDFLIFSLNDVTERTQAQMKLRENEGLLRTVLENLPLGVWITDRQERISYVNPPFLKIHGLTPETVVGQRYDGLLSPGIEGEEFRETMVEALRRGQTWRGHLTRKLEGEAPLELDLTVSPVKEEGGAIINYVSVERDVTEEIRLQEHLRQMQKMEALGTLAGGIAHDFNNILMPIAINTELALLDAARGSLLSNYLQLVLDAATRGKELVKQIITFSRQKEQERKPMDVVPLVKEALKFFRASIPKNIEIRERIEPTSSLVPTDPSLIHQILMNLCSNAAHAMREQGGEMEVRLINGEFDAKEAAEHVELRPGPYLQLSVSDTGHGMEKDIMERAFDPFFTTKKPGEGTGMGLAVVHGIVKSHKGMITVESEPGKGATFHIYLPRVTAEPEAEATAPIPILRGSERILLIDDEPAQVQTVQYMLERLGYQVTGKTDATEALRIFRSQPDAFDLVITDQTMPHITGEKLAREFLALRPDLPVLLCTGFSEVIDEEGARAMGIKEFLMKPYAVGEISEKIRRALKN